jgi:cell division septation protein DedD
MARDYAKIKTKPSKRRKASSSRRKSNAYSQENRLWIVVLLLVGCFMGGLIYLKHVGKQFVHVPAPLVCPSKPALHATAASPVSNSNPPPPQFDFYTMLPKEQVATPAANKQNAHLPQSNARAEIAVLEKEQLTAESGSAEPNYIVQLGVFKEFASADALKAQLGLLGIEVSIEKVKKNNITLYQVQKGPYVTRQEACSIQKSLQASHIKSDIVKK